MTYKNTLIKSATGLAGVATLLAGFALTASAATTTPATALAKVISRSDSAITTRVNALNNLSTRISNMKNVSAATKTAITTEVQTEVGNLTTLKAKIDADTDLATAKADAKTITGDYRIYALVIPQGYIISSADRVGGIVGLINAIQTKLQTRITDAKTNGKDVTALETAMTDMTAKLADATTQASSAQSGVSALTPDKGDATVAASNKAALVAARANIKTANADLKAARKDIQTIRQGLKAMHVTVPAGTTAPTI